MSAIPSTTPPGSPPRRGVSPTEAGEGHVDDNFWLHIPDCEEVISQALGLISNSVVEQQEWAHAAIMSSNYTLWTLIVLAIILKGMLPYVRWTPIAVLVCAIYIIVFRITRLYTKPYLTQAKEFVSLHWWTQTHNNDDNNVLPQGSPGEALITILIKLTRCLNRGIVFDCFFIGRGLNPDPSGKKMALVTAILHEKVVAAVLMGIDPCPDYRTNGRTDAVHQEYPATCIYAWVVKPEYRFTRVGALLLTTTTIICHAQGWGAPAFADDHVHSLRFALRETCEEMDQDADRAKAKLALLVDMVYNGSHEV